MPFPIPSNDLMATAMGGPLLSTTSSNVSSNNLTLASAVATTSAKAKKDVRAGSGTGTVRIFYSLKENPNAIISYTDLIRQEQKRQRMIQVQSSSLPSKNNVTPNIANSAPSTPLKNQKTKEGGATTTQPSPSVSAMDIDPPEGEEALGDVEADSEAEDDDEADEDEDENENEDDAEAEEEEGDEDPDEEENDDDDLDSARRGPKDFLDSLTEKYAGLEEGNEGEDEDEDEDEDDKGRVYKRSSRWDTEHYDIEDEFIDDSEMMLESIGMVRPKVEGFFAYRGPVETTTEDPDSSDAGLRTRKAGKRKTAAGASPLSTVKTNASKSAKGSSLAIMENANDSTSEMSEMDEKPKTSKASSSGSGLANSSTVPADITGGEGGMSSVTTTPTKKKTNLSKSKALAKETSKDGTEANKDSDKESKAGSNKKTKSKLPKATTSSTLAATSVTPIVRVDSPPPLDGVQDNGDNSSPPLPMSRSASPSRSKGKLKAPAAMDTDSCNAEGSVELAGSQESSSGQNVSESQLVKPESLQESVTSTSEVTEQSTQSTGSKALEPLNEMVQEAYNIVADLARKETWEHKSKFPPHIKEPLWNCAKIALRTRSSGYMLKDDFFLHLQEVFPYNKFTLRKLIYKQVLPEWIAELEEEKTKAMEQFSKRVKMISKAYNLTDIENAPSDKDGDGDTNMNGEEVKRKFPWTQDLRMLLWETMEKIMEIYYARQELRTVDDSVPAQNTDSKTRKDTYQLLLQSFPVGWMTSYEISRQYSQLKEKVQKQGKKPDDSANNGVPIGKPKPILSGNSGPRSSIHTTAARSAIPSSSTGATADTTVSPSTVASTGSSSAQNLTSPTTELGSPSAPAPGSLAVSAATVGLDGPIENHRMSSPSRSPLITHRPIQVPEAVSPVPQHSRSQHGPFAGGPASSSSSNDISKKRKNLDEASISMYGSGSSHDPLFIDESGYDESLNRRGYRQNSGSLTDYVRPSSSSPSISSIGQPMYAVPNESTKKKKVADQRHAVLSSSNHRGLSTSYYQEYTDYPEYKEYSEYQDYPGSRESSIYQSQRHPASPPQNYPGHGSLGYPGSRAQHSHYQHEVPPDPYYHRHVSSPGSSPGGGGGGGGGGGYSSSAHPTSASRAMQHQQQQGSSLGSPSSGSASKAMSMNNLLHHPSHHTR
ncbi:hypothetical protein BX616_005115 [Lobosporangium transversale]|uniref:Ubinuclein middle domain-containing protein n=1 Tax=Lobosporangium transversale TaxID=64571 RepID=A0A1Y2H0J8_9FUNG|nr:hypothetical protein BCR41DRAFT_346938 [Lobosporangium transversale]KAF9915896.1 hypothetical protein BX616_005115 [Lobosporangium transversale]ORZ27531.1 hypothetical protein BCR41DRAFT_346938 [Lobosporangium transversale]|eukprot:XP_021885258.1 hypothetical protein BCR41DRAFT_346938 [Lobosporangium transversale]